MFHQSLKFFFKLIVTFLLTITSFHHALAWSGFDYENDANIDVGPGNLVRENNVITIFDWKDNQYHDVEVTRMESSFNGTRLEVIDLDSKQKRVFEMESE